MEIFYCLLTIVIAIVMGLISMVIGTNKGYSSGSSFCWGFFLGIIGIIVEAVRPVINK